MDRHDNSKTRHRNSKHFSLDPYWSNDELIRFWALFEQPLFQKMKKNSFFIQNVKNQRLRLRSVICFFTSFTYVFNSRKFRKINVQLLMELFYKKYDRQMNEIIWLYSYIKFKSKRSFGYISRQFLLNSVRYLEVHQPSKMLTGRKSCAIIVFYLVRSNLYLILLNFISKNMSW